MTWILTALPAVLVGGLLALVASIGYRLWRSAMRDEPLLLHEVLARQGLSLEGRSDPTVVRETAAAVRRCLLCKNRATCVAWLDGRVAGSLERFCPNTELMAQMKAARGG